MSVIQSTYKSKDTEEFLDRHFYRILGYRLALIAKTLRISPNGVTFLGMLTGVFAGFFFFSDDLIITVIACLLLILSEALDSADGQLARMTQKISNIGRVLDGIATYFIFVAIYLAIYYRITDWTWRWDAFIIIVLTLLSHTLQAFIADYYRNCYQQFGENGGKSELESSRQIKDKYNSTKKGFNKIVLFLYYRYTLSQELFTGVYNELRYIVEDFFQNSLPPSFTDFYIKHNKSQIKYYSILTSNTRMIVLIIAMLVGCPYLYLGFVLLPMNMILVYVLLNQRIIGIKLINFINSIINNSNRLLI